MKKKYHILTFLVMIVFSCNTETEQEKEVKNENTGDLSISVQRGEMFSVEVDIFDEKNIFNQETPNATLRIKDLQRTLYFDSIYSRVGEVEWKDYNGDSIKDILVQNISDARSNWTHFLFLIDPENDTIQKINGFDDIKNPKMNYDAGVIESYVMSGTDYYEFYQIRGDSVIKLDYFLYDKHDDSSYAKYEEIIEMIKIESKEWKNDN